MSKIDDLINKLCPNGVEYKTIGEIATYRRGSFPQPYTNSSFYGGSGAMPFVQVADIEDDGFVLKECTKQTISKIAQPKSIFVPKGSVICSIQGTIGRVAITQYDAYVDRTIAIFDGFKININKRFFAYCIQVKFGIEKQFARGSTLKTITKEEFTKFCIPVPPLEVQCEIVHILDDFTLLSAELSAELKARQQQYDYYKTKLFEFSNDAEYLPLEKIAEIGTGSSNTNEAVDDGKYPFFVRSQQLYRKNTFEYDETAIITSGDGVGVGKIFHYIEGKYALHQRAYRIHIINEKVIPKYFFYYMKTTFYDYIMKNAFNSSVTSVRRPMLNKYPVPIPSKEEQERIVNILDRFDKLCNDITEGLPAEIEARQKQYGYYRDKLLTFKELKVSEVQ